MLCGIDHRNDAFSAEFSYPRFVNRLSALPLEPLKSQP
jgi:hypothetical protein